MLPCYYAAVIRTLFLLPMVLFTLVAACSGASSDTASKQTPTIVAAIVPSAVTGCSTPRPHAAGDFDQSMESGGSSRTYILHIPTGYDGNTPAPLLIPLHGYGLSAKQMDDYTRFGALSDMGNAIIATPNGSGAPQRWNWRKALGEPDDVQFATDLLDKVVADLCIDEDRIFVAGFSDGAAMSRILACALPARIAAIATVSAPSVPCAAAVPMVGFHGTADPLIPFEGGVVPQAVGGGGTFPPVRRSVSEWARALGCDGLAIISRPAATVELSTYVRCLRGDGEALLYTAIGAGHTWPDAPPLPPEQFGPTLTGLDATSIIWSFFVAHPLAH